MSKSIKDVVTDAGSEGSSNAVALTQPVPNSAAVHATSSDPNLVSGASSRPDVFFYLYQKYPNLKINDQIP
jgi:hypothetical protein